MKTTPTRHRPGTVRDRLLQAHRWRQAGRYPTQSGGFAWVTDAQRDTLLRAVLTEDRHRLTPAEERAAGRLVEHVASPRSVLPGVLWTFWSAVLAGVLFLCLVWPR